MAITAEGRALTEAHRRAQVGVSTSSVADLRGVWPILDLNDPRTFPEYARWAQLVIASGRSKSAATTAAYLRSFRLAEGVTGPLSVALAAELANEAAMTSLLVTGPVAYRTAIRGGKTPERASQIALSQTSGAIVRLVQNSGRETIVNTILRDDKAHGVARVTDGKPCAFCAMLASRGAVYKSEMTADFKAHDKCGCQAEPIYSLGGRYSLPNAAQAERWNSLYEEHAAGTSDPIAAFRKAYREL